MKVFLAVCKEQHIDDDYGVFEHLETAIDFCRRFAEANSSYGDPIEHQIDGWLYFADWGESNSVHVEELELEP